MAIGKFVEEDVREAAFKVKAPPYNPPESQCFGGYWLGDDAAVCMKKGLNPNVRASSPLGFRPFFSLLTQTRGTSSADCRTVDLCGGDAVFLRKNERVFALRRG